MFVTAKSYFKARWLSFVLKIQMTLIFAVFLSFYLLFLIIDFMSIFFNSFCGYERIEKDINIKSVNEKKKKKDGGFYWDRELFRLRNIRTTELFCIVFFFFFKNLYCRDPISVFLPERWNLSYYSKFFFM